MLRGLGLPFFLDNCGRWPSPTDAPTAVPPLRPRRTAGTGKRMGPKSRWPLHRGFPNVRVPVLSNAMRVILDSRSNASPSRTRNPCRVALPMAAMMAVGVASTKAQGQNTTRMVTARMISPVTNQVMAALVRATTTIQVGPSVRQPQRSWLSPRPRIVPAGSSVGWSCLPPLWRLPFQKLQTGLPCRWRPRLPATFIHRHGFPGHHRLVHWRSGL